MPMSTMRPRCRGRCRSTSEPRMPIGMSRCGILAPPAPRSRRRRSRCRRRTSRPRRGTRRSSRTGRTSPVFGGMNGNQFARLTYGHAEATTEHDDHASTTTITVLNRADSLDADDEQAGHEQHDHDRRQVEDGRARRAVGSSPASPARRQRGGNVDPEVSQKAEEVARPADGDGRRRRARIRGSGPSR